MVEKSTTYCFSQIHIDAARNSTDDFNPFHDKTGWQEISGNPFGCPIVLGFQQLGFIADQFEQYRRDNDELSLLERENLTYSYYQLNFSSAIKAGDQFEFEIKDSRFKESENKVLSNRFLIKNNGGLAMIGYKRESQKPLVLESSQFCDYPDLSHVPDRTFVGDTNYFLKRKFLTTSNGKNFLLGALVEQSYYFDELADYVNFPESFPLALISCGLLEYATYFHHDFLKNPMVYVSHELCVDRKINAMLSSNDALVMLIEKQENDDQLETYHCYGLLDNKTILYRSIIKLAPLGMVIKN